MGKDDEIIIEEIRGGRLLLDTIGYRTAIKHEKLNKYQVMTDKSHYDLWKRASAKIAHWNAQWEKEQQKEKEKQERERIKLEKEEQQEKERLEREKNKRDINNNILLASTKTQEAIQEIELLSQILCKCLTSRKSFNWGDLFALKGDFDLVKPPNGPAHKSLPPKPVLKPYQPKPFLNILPKPVLEPLPPKPNIKLPPKPVPESLPQKPPPPPPPPPPSRPKPIEKPPFPSIPTEPKRTDTRYNPKTNFLYKILKPLQQKREKEMEQKFQADYLDWLVSQKQPIEKKYTHYLRLWEQECRTQAQDYQESLSRWEQSCKIAEEGNKIALSKWEQEGKDREKDYQESLSRWEQKVKDKELAYQRTLIRWEQSCKDIEKENNAALWRWEQSCKIVEEENKIALSKWEKLNEEYIEEINKNQLMLKEEYLNGGTELVLELCKEVFLDFDYPNYFPQSYDLDYSPSNRLLVVDYQLPSPFNIPTLREIKYVQSSGQFKELHSPQSQINKLYDSIVYQIALSTIYKLFNANHEDVVVQIVFNGYVKSINPSTGKEITTCIVSLQTDRNEFMEINLANVDPKACFQKLKGVGSSQLYSITPIAPIMIMNREDRRFVDSYEVAHTIDESVNIAAMDWEDFEHLIRELFEQEFSQYDGEVKITQASRDRGVDAVAFDPDPIRGGKIVIQAKRYTNTVGVSAVRDLYGTVINEGATKGILISTADYGPDAYQFAKGKPLTLLNGGNLLHLLEKHGHKAKIDLLEAKKLIAEKEKQKES